MQRLGMQVLSKALAMIFLAMVIQSGAHAAELGDDLAIHGYGYQSFFQGKENNYLGSAGDGSWGYNVLDLLFTAKLDDNTKLWMQVMNTVEVSTLDWAFVDHQFTPALSGRAGQIKFPYGLYNEIFETRFLHLSNLPPSLYQDASGMRFENYRGIAVNYKHELGAGSLTWDIYSGEAIVPEEVGITKFGRLVGGRVTLKTPVDGLRLMFSAFSSNETSVATGVSSTQHASALSVDYFANSWDLKAESARNRNHAGLESSTWYIQAGYTVGEKWTPFVRYDYITTDESQKSDPSYYQQTNTVGFDYRLNNNVSFRVEDHIIKGYALPVMSYAPAAPGTPATGVAAGTGEENWNLFAASVNFIF